MIIESLELNNFGPFSHYNIKFPEESHSCILLTGKNNEGKSSILFAIRLVAIAMQSVDRPKLRIIIKGDEYYRLPQHITSEINIGKTLHNYAGDNAKITAIFSSGLKIIVYLDEIHDLIYSDFVGQINPDIRDIIGFIPPLGPLAENEELLTIKHIEASINSSLAPRHLRNHLKQIITSEEYNLIQQLINESWPSIKLLECTHDIDYNLLKCYFKEKTIDREIAWAGQGLQVWFQIITHLIRLRHCSLMIFDEPEINLHPEKQNDLVNIMNEYFGGDTIIATHSVELMNNVNVSHILHIQKLKSSPIIKSSDDRLSLELIRSQIGSNFNLVASQFEKCDILLFAEDNYDYKIIDAFMNLMRIKRNIFFIPLHGFAEYDKAKYYKNAYKMLIGKEVPSIVLLDRDYYPEEYLRAAKNSLEKYNIRAVFTPGKEIENCFIHPKLIKDIITTEHFENFEYYWNKIYQDEYHDSYGSFLTLHSKFLPKHLDIKTITKKYGLKFESYWNNIKKRHLWIGGKKALKYLRNYYSKTYRSNISQKELNERIVKLKIGEIEKMINAIIDPLAIG
jgi:hypothetical protein